MTYKQFKDKWIGKPCEVTGSDNAKNQCVDLANAYIRDVCSLPIIKWTNAKDFPKKCLAPDYEWIKNNPKDAKQIPEQGDLMIFDSPDNIGHISIFDNGVVGENKFVSFDQNFPLKSFCKLVTHAYTGTYKILGWLRPRGIISDMTAEEKNILKFLEGKTEGDVRQAFGCLADNKGLKATISDQYKEMDKLNEKYNKLLEDFNVLLPKYEELTKKPPEQIDTPKKLSLKEILILLINKIFSK